MKGLALAAIAGLLAVLVNVIVIHYQAEGLEDHPLPPPAPIASTAGPARPGSTAGADAQAHVDRILARPLFNASRRPAAVAAEAGTAVTLPRLSAVVVSSRGRSVTFAASGNGKPVTLAEGGRIGAYVVQSIGAGQVTVLGPDGQHVLRPALDGKAPAATEPAAAAPQQPSMLDLLRQNAVLPGLPPPAPAPR